MRSYEVEKVLKKRICSNEVSVYFIFWLTKKSRMTQNNLRFSEGSISLEMGWIHRQVQHMGAFQQFVGQRADWPIWKGQRMCDYWHQKRRSRHQISSEIPSRRWTWRCVVGYRTQILAECCNFILCQPNRMVGWQWAIHKWTCWKCRDFVDGQCRWRRPNQNRVWVHFFHFFANTFRPNISFHCFLLKILTLVVNCVSWHNGQTKHTNGSNWMKQVTNGQISSFNFSKKTFPSMMNRRKFSYLTVNSMYSAINL